MLVVLSFPIGFFKNQASEKKNDGFVCAPVAAAAAV